MLLAALVELGVSVSELRDCHGRACLAKFEKRSRDVLRVDWRPISVFPKEAKRFR
jgi:hypothetical protein